MAKSKFAKTLIILSLCYLPLSSMAWGLLGHRVVGQIAESYLKRKTSREIRKILGNETLAMASNWGDFIKSDPDYKYLDNWHYVNLPIGADVTRISHQLSTDTIPGVYNRISLLTAELKKKDLPAEQKVLYLRMLIHLVGDVHQPLHCVGEALGGNRIQLTWFGEPSNLHRVWDSDLVDSQHLSYTEYARAINFPGKESLNEWMRHSPSVWVTESNQLGGKIFAEVNTNDKLSYKYIYDHLETANQQMLKGGIRLAAVLNDIFGS